MNIVVSVLLVAVVAVNAEVGHTWDKPRFCGRYSCPRFWTVERMPGYDTRCYTYSTWAVTKAKDLDQKYYKNEFRRLYSYLRGSNDQHKDIPMAVPVGINMRYNLTDHTTASGLGFYVPTKCQKKTPQPTDSKVFLKKLQRFCVYVRSFSGYVMGRSNRMYRNLGRLSKDLKRDGRDYLHRVSMSHSYNSPWKIFWRHNEVWRFLTKSKEEELMKTIEDPAFENPPCEM